MTLGTQQPRQSMKSSSGSSETHFVTPQSIKSVLLADGWHEVQGNCEYTTQYAIAQANSPAQPNAVFAALRFTDKKSGKDIYVPVTKILAVEADSQSS